MTAVQVNRRGPVFDSGLCRCCGVTKKCRLLNHEYECLGHKEVYSDMFLDCFGLVLSNLDGEQEDRLVCATCVTRLRDACAFRRQVLSCEERLLRTSIQVHAEGEENNSLKLEMDIKVEPVTSPEDVDSQSVEVDYASDIGDYEDSIKKKALVKMSKKLKKMNGSKSLKSTKELKEKRACLKKLKKLGDDIKKFSESDRRSLSMSLWVPPAFKQQQRTKHNTITIIENSYVCPFYNYFSNYFCVYCKQEFSDPVSLREHSLIHDPVLFKDKLIYTNKKIQIDTLRIDCRLCPERIDNIEYLKCHLTSVHGKVLHSVADDFLRFVLTDNVVSCLECNAQFKFFHALKQHMAVHFGTYVCDICGARYFEERILKQHTKKRHGSEETTYLCKQCGKSFKSKYGRDLHENKIHNKQATYLCMKCDELFLTYSQRYRHLMEVHGEKRNFHCLACNRVYDSRKSLREHNNTKHLKVFRHQCMVCGERFYTPSTLKDHMVKHTGERNFRCECGKSFLRKKALTLHMKTHDANGKYTCEICNSSYTQKVTLRNHIMKKHKSECLKMENAPE